VAVPISKIPEIVQFIKDDITKHSIIGPIVSHAGDGNVHALLLFRDDQELEAVKGVVKRMVKEAQRLNGTASGEHGVGIGKLEYMEGELGTGTVNLLRSIKELLDPQNIMVSFPFFTLSLSFIR
jgi:D-lactate dehydrogenase (cytochrome)